MTEIDKNIKVFENGKIDIHRRNEKYVSALGSLDCDVSILKDNRVLISRFIRDCSLGKTVKGRAKKKIGSARCLFYLYILKKLSLYWNKSFDDLSQDDMERFVQDLENGVFRSRKGLPYSDETKADFKKTIKKFWKWKDGDNRFYPDLVDWIECCVRVKDVPALRRYEVEKMIDAATNSRNKALLMVLFDSGARAEELLNIRLKPEHVFWKDELGCYMVRLEFSKTKPRTISLPLSTEYLRRWLEDHPARNNPDAQLFPMSYGNMRMTISRMGMKVLNKRVFPHMLRHSSATFYANKLKSPYKLCYRYGWAMASNQVNRYLDREGILEEETSAIVKSDEMTVLDRKNRDLGEELTLLKESNRQLLRQYEDLKIKSEQMTGGVDILGMIAALAEKQERMLEVINELTGKKVDFEIPGVLNLSHCKMV